MTIGPAEKRLASISEYSSPIMSDLMNKQHGLRAFGLCLEYYAGVFGEIAKKPGFEGESAEMAKALFGRESVRAESNTEQVKSLGNQLYYAMNAVSEANGAYHRLPDTTLNDAELNEDMMRYGPAGPIPGIIYSPYSIEQRQQELYEIREKEARESLNIFKKALIEPTECLREIRQKLDPPPIGGIAVGDKDDSSAPESPDYDDLETDRPGGQIRKIPGRAPSRFDESSWAPLPEGVHWQDAGPEVGVVSPVGDGGGPGTGAPAPAPGGGWSPSPDPSPSPSPSPSPGGAAADGSVGGVIDYGQPGGPGGAGSAGGGAGTGGLSGNAGLGVAGIGAAGAVGAGAASVAGLGRGGQGGPGVIGPGGPGGTGGGGSGTGSGSSSGVGASSRSGGLSGAGGPGDVSSGQGGVRGVDGRIIHGGQGGQVGVGGMSESERRARRLARHGVFAEREEEDEARRKKKEEEARAARKPVDPDAWCIVPSLADLEESARQEAKYQREKATTADGWIRPCDLLIRLADRINTQTQLAAEATNTAELARFAAETAQADQDTDPESLTKLVEKARTTASASLAANQALDATYADLDRARAADEKFRTDNIRFRETVHKKQYKYWLKDQAEKARINALFRNRLRRLLHIDPPLVQEQFIPREIPDYLIK